MLLNEHKRKTTMAAGSLTTISNEMHHQKDSQSTSKQLETFCKAVVSVASMNKKVNAVNYSVPRAEGSSLPVKSNAGNDQRCTDLDTTCPSTSSTGNTVGTFTTAISTKQRSNSKSDLNVITSLPVVKKLGAIGSNTSSAVPTMTIGTRSRSRSASQVEPQASVPPSSLPENTTNDDDESSRRSRRQRRPQASKEKHFVKYNMSTTPHFQRNVAFLRSLSQKENDSQHQQENQPHRTRRSSDSASVMENSLIWIPHGREEWFDCTDELAALCAEASLRWALSPKTLVFLTTLMSSGQQQQAKIASFAPESTRNLDSPVPLSKAYIRERLDIDDPLRGYQIRHAQGGWLQGFLIWTTFTTWTRYFQWNSLHPESGMLDGDFTREGRLYDVTGEFANELEAQRRSGDPLKGGVISPNMAEIGLVGGLGCGEYLLHMALEDIARQGCYEYVILQATETSWSFYEKFGFIRIGAVCTYGQSDSVCGYRHWTYADETNLDTRHGGPSYMMAKKIQPRPSDDPESPLSAFPRTGIWEALQSKVVTEKPTILSWTKQDDYLLDHPNPYASAIVDVMKKGNTWWKQLDSATYNQLMLPRHVQQSYSTKSVSSGSQRRIKIVTPRSSASIVPRVVSSSVTSTASTLVYSCAKSKNAIRGAGGMLEGETRSSKRIKLIHTSLTRITLETTTTVTPAKAGIQRKEESLSAASRPPAELCTRSRQRSNVQAPPAVAKPVAVDLSLEKPVCRMDKNRILKQKFTDKPNAKDVNPFFFNKIVTPKRRNNSGAPPSGPYYFVVYYDKKKNQLTIIELEAHGNFLGKLKRRTRWRAVQRDSKDKRSLLKVVDGSDYEIVPAEMVTKSSCVHEEGWNLLIDEGS